MKILIGIALGVVLTVFYPDIVPLLKSAFVDSGARDLAVESLTNIK
jgi:hypothetical protein